MASEIAIAYFIDCFMDSKSSSMTVFRHGRAAPLALLAARFGHYAASRRQTKDGMDAFASPHRQSIRASLAALARRNDVKTIVAPVARDFEIAACLAEMDEGPALRFDDVIGAKMPVIGNLLNSLPRFADLLGFATADLQSSIIAAIDKPKPHLLIESAPCQEQVSLDPRLIEELPIPRFFEKETGAYITAGVIIAKDRLSGRANLSIARVKPLNGNRALVGIAPNHHLAILGRAAAARGELLDIAVCIGNHPAVLLAACLYLGLGDDELEVAGALFGESVEVVRCLGSDLLVPAQCECVLEGKLDYTELVEEGPVSEFHGMYETYGAGAVATFQRLTRRHDALFQVILPGYHAEHCLLGGVAISAGLARQARASVASIQTIAVGLGGAGRLHAVVTLRTPQPGDARKAMFAVWAAVNLIKQIIVVDDDIDPWNSEMVNWAIATRMKAERDLVVIPDVRTDRSEPLETGRTITKLGMDATRRADDRPDWTQAKPPAEAIVKARQILAAEVSSSSPSNLR
jgi:2,5-furandicarboxylate decarboxylase 1